MNTEETKLTSQEKLMLNTQILQFVSINFNTLLQNFQILYQEHGKEGIRLNEMIDLHNEVNQDLAAVRDKLLNTLDGWDAIAETDMSFINPMLELLNHE